MADSQLNLGLMFLQIRGGCSLTVLLFFLMFVGTCCFILSASLCVVRPTYRASHRHALFLNYLYISAILSFSNLKSQAILNRSTLLFIKKLFIRKQFSAAQKVKQVQYWIFET